MTAGNTIPYRIYVIFILLALCLSLCGLITLSYVFGLAYRAFLLGAGL